MGWKVLKELLSYEGQSISATDPPKMILKDYIPAFVKMQARIFTKVAEDLKEYPEKTSLQCAAKQYLLQGRSLGNGFGVLRKW